MNIGTAKVTAKNIEDVQPGNWYFGFDCLECPKRFAVFDDESDGNTPVQFTGGGHILVSCPHCSADRMYSVDQVVQFQHP